MADPRIAPSLAVKVAAATQTFDSDEDRELWEDGFMLGYETGMGVERKAALAALPEPDKENTHG